MPAKKHIAILLFLVLSQTISAQTKPLEIHQIAQNAFAFTSYKDLDGEPFPANGMYLVTKEGVVILDTPWTESYFQPLLDSIEKRHSKKPILCIAMDSHADRSAGLEYFRSKGIKTYTTVQTKKISKERGEKQAEFTFRKDTIFKVGEFHLETFYPGRGHTPDNIVVWIPELSILYGGCFIKSTENESIGYLGDADLKQWPKSVQKVKKRFPNPKIVIPGHFKWSGKEALDHTFRLLKQSKR